MRILYKENPRIVALSSSTHALVFLTVNDSNSLNNIRDGDVRVELMPKSAVTPSRGFKALAPRDGKVLGFLGMLRVAGQIFLTVVSGAVQDVAHPLPYESVNRIYSVEFVSLNSDEWDSIAFGGSRTSLADSEDPDGLRSMHPCYELRKLLSNGSFYYSNDFDLTTHLQDRGVEREKLESPVAAAIPTVDCHNDRDNMWNYYMMKELLRFRNNLDADASAIIDRNRFLTTVIRGFAKTLRLPGLSDTISLISKQSWRRAGTRYNCRGIDDGGFVANFVETEFCWYNATHKSICAFVQIRGSVPTFWEQDANMLNPKITLTRSLEATQPVFDKHFFTVTTKYGPCHVVNLLSKTKSAEIDVLNRYRQLYEHSDRPNEIAYTEFDFHAETKPLSGGFAGASKILPLLRSSLESFGWFYYDIALGETITRQDGGFRVNCLDCLDRTNLIQQVICQHVLESILKNSGSGRGADTIIALHNTCWADNGDAISQIYTGTNALKSSFSRSGKMNIAGALLDVTKSVSRIYQNTFVDGKKQSTMDTLLGVDAKHSLLVTIYDPVTRHVNNSLHEQRNEYIRLGSASIFIGTFNVNACLPQMDPLDLSSWLFPPQNSNKQNPDIYAIGLQEIVELSAGSILAADGSKPAQWTRLLTLLLNNGAENYVLLRTESMSSMSLHLYVRLSSMQYISEVAGSSKKTGMGGITANKGACAVRFEYGLTSFALVGSHLAAGVTAVTERYNDYMAINQGLTFPRNRTIRDHDHVVWFGDLNYRIYLSSLECRSLVDAGAFDDLIHSDQLKQEMSQHGAFAGFKEGRILFHPTYKFDRGTSEYDSSEKQRVPSWTDRVLYYTAPGKELLKQLNYLLVMSIQISDHKPVFATFQATVEFVDKTKKRALARSLYEQCKSNGTRSSGSSSIDLNVSQLSDARSQQSTPLEGIDLIGLDLDSILSRHTDNDQISSMFRQACSNTTSPASAPVNPLLHTPVRRANTLARRVPPPPERRSICGLHILPLLYPLEGAGPNLAPLPPPRRAATIMTGRLTPSASSSISFTSAPLVPTCSTTEPAVSNARNVSSEPIAGNREGSALSEPLSSIAVTADAHDDARPAKPKKPHSLSSSKTHVSLEKFLNRDPFDEDVKQSMTMIDWKPMVPK